MKQTEDQKAMMVELSLPLFIKDFEKHFEVEQIRTNDTFCPIHLRVKPLCNVINAYWIQKIAQQYVCEIHKDGLHILGIKNRLNWLELFNLLKANNHEGKE